jgi:hypothetical protein
MMAIAGAAFMTMLLMAFLAAADLPSLDFSFGSDTPAAYEPAAVMPADVKATDAPPPTWVTDPLAPPFPELAR